MTYNWQLENWPFYTFNHDLIADLQLNFGIKTGEMSGLIAGLPEEHQNETLMELMGSETIKTSAIEGEFLSRQEVMSSIKKNLSVHDQFPRQIKDHRVKGIAQLMVAIRETYNRPMGKEMLFDWHSMLMLGNKYINAGQWRSDPSPMQVVSGSIGKETVHYEAPPSEQVSEEMAYFITWFNETAPGQKKAINNPIIRDAITHWHFE
jgi:Fic family protein